MRRVILLLALAACVAGCEKKSTRGAGASGGSGSGGGGLLSQDDAELVLWKLPEVDHWANNVRRRGRGKVRPVTAAERTPADCRADGDKRLTWQFYAGESHGTHMVMWNRFRVDAASGDIYVWDPLDDSYMTLVAWRRGHRDR